MLHCGIDWVGCECAAGQLANNSMPVPGCCMLHVEAEDKSHQCSSQVVDYASHDSVVCGELTVNQCPLQHNYGIGMVAGRSAVCLLIICNGILLLKGCEEWVVSA